MARKRRDRVQARDNRHADLLVPLPQLDEDELLAAVDRRDIDFVLILDRVEDPHNLGACLRSADGAGVQAVIAPKDRACGVTQTVRKISAGGAEQVPLVRVTNLARCMNELRKLGMHLCGTADAATKPYYKASLKGSVGIVMGAEGTGMRRLTADSCDELVVIPMAGEVDCLNVSVATGVLLFEVVRQRSH